MSVLTVLTVQGGKGGGRGGGREALGRKKGGKEGWRGECCKNGRELRGASSKNRFENLG